MANTRDYWLGWGSADRCDGELTLYRSGVSHPQLNGVLRAGGGIAVEEAVAQARERLAGVPWMWWVGPDSRPGLAEGLAAAGAAEVATMPVMAVALDRVTMPDGPAGLRIEEVTGADALREWVSAYAPSFGVMPDQVEQVTRVEEWRGDEEGAIVRFAGRLDGRVVGTSVLLDRRGVAGIYVVTTREGYRRRGIGAALTAAALQEGRERGLRVATLQASAMGAPVYRRMGFEVVSAYRMFTLPPAAG
ncbi:hypothetical protein BKM31_03090 [[Actinomadura] parvosata subsp. kistnae]|uniref:N-acetyltransferase domain-containing protein n=1 Tax=[Actinomadura] parvosata subsp. kistnae TaxID=1909395 RepID=A0A1V0AJ12_9ACTN|nr:hypothetical protein BKM31_03090 [Nonomuraea sp. ATCC 55076]